MAVANSLQKTTQKKMGLTDYLSQSAVQEQIKKVVGKNSEMFVTSLVSAVNQNPQLSECSNSSLIASCLIGSALKLSPSPQLGHFYLVPFNDKKKGKVAQFNIGWRGYVQLAIRSGQYKKINVIAIKDGELIRFDPLNEEIEVKLIEDEDDRDRAETIGYYAFFELLNGFRKNMYMTKSAMEAHALKYSSSYAYDKKNGTKMSLWTTAFETMALKTMLRQLLGKFGLLSVEMQSAYTNDMSVVDENGNNIYVDGADGVVADVVADAEIKEFEEPETIQPEGDDDDAVQQALFGNQ